MARHAPLAAVALVLALALAAADAAAQVGVRIHVGLPAQPRLVAVQPGIHVVADVPEPIYVTRGFYWLRRDGRWFRAPSPAASFSVVDARQVPRPLVTLAAATVVVAQAHPAPPPGRAPPPPAPAYEHVVRAKEVRADRVVARVIYAKELRARDGEVLRVVRDRKSKEWERGRSDGELDVPELQADVIYAKEIHADWVQADEVHAQKVKIGR